MTKTANRSQIDLPVDSQYNPVPLEHSPILQTIAGTQAEYRSDTGIPKDTPYLTLMGKL